MKIGNREIGSLHSPFVIAEMSGNHNSSLERALEIVDQAAAAGVDAIKLQTYTADTMTIDKKDGEFYIDDPSSLWHGYSLYELYEKAHTPWDWHQPLMERAREHGILCFSSPFDKSSVDFLEKLDVPAYKIASFEIVDLPLVQYVAETQKPLIVSTGMASINEVAEAVQTIRATGNEQFVLLKCTSSYPASPTCANVRTVPHLRELFQCEVGLSDHTQGIGVALAAVALGASMIEKHFTLDRADGGVDSEFSMEPDEMKLLVEESKRAWLALGNIAYGATEREKASLVFRRSLYVIKDLQAGDVLTSANLRSIRPGHGLSPKYLEMFLGKRVNQDVARGTPLSWEFVG